MNKFRVGDKVRRINYFNPSDKSYNGMKVGDVDIVVEARGFGVDLKEFGTGHANDCLELLQDTVPHEFEVGDRVKVCGNITYKQLKTGDTYTISKTVGNALQLKGEGDKWFIDEAFQPVDASLDSDLKDAEQQLVVVNDGVYSLEQRIKYLRKAIKERDKPRGRVDIKDSLSGVDIFFLACANGRVKQHRYNCCTKDHITMGSLFYDEESAERYVHDRKQAVLCGHTLV